MKILITLMAIFVINIAHGSEELAEKTSVANQADLIGVWRMVSQQLPKNVDPASLFFAPYQIFHFAEDGKVRNFASDKGFSDADIDLYLKTAPALNKYKAEGGLLSTVSPDGKTTSIVVSKVDKDFLDAVYPGGPKLEKGMLIFSYIQPNKKVYLRRYLARYNK